MPDEEQSEKWSKHRWTVVGLHEPNKYRNDAFVCYVGADTAKEAAEWAVRVNAERGDKIDVIACVPGGHVAVVFRPDNELLHMPYTPDYTEFGDVVKVSAPEDAVLSKCSACKEAEVDFAVKSTIIALSSRGEAMFNNISTAGALVRICADCMLRMGNDIGETLADGGVDLADKVSATTKPTVQP